MRLKNILIYLLLITTKLISQNDTVQIKSLNEYAWKIKNKNTDSAIILSQNALKISKKTSWLVGISKSFHQLAWFYYMKSDYILGVRYSKLAIKLRAYDKNKNNLAKSMNNLGVIYQTMGNNNLAIQNFYSCLKIQESLDEKRGTSISYLNIGNVYIALKNYKEALKFYKKSLSIATIINDSTNIANCYANLGLIFKNINEIDSALLSTNKAHNLYSLTSNPFGIAKMLSQQATIYLSDYETKNNSNLLDSGLKYIQKSILIRTEIKDNQGLGYDYGIIGSIYLYQKKYQNSKKYLLKGLKILDSINVITQKLNFYQSLIKLSVATNDYKTAYLYSTKIIQLNTIISNQENDKKLNQTRYEYEYTKKFVADSIKNEEILKFNKLESDTKIKKQKYFTLFGICGFVLMLIVAVISFRAYKNKNLANTIINSQKNKIETKQKEILESIHYAKRIQNALLPNERYIKRKLNDLNKS